MLYLKINLVTVQMKNSKKFTGFFILIILMGFQAKAQIETTTLFKNRIVKETKSIFFTNRPIEINPDNSVTFRNKSTIQTNTLYFCTYDYDNDSIELYYRAINFSNGYPKEKVKNNIFYDMYEFQRLKRGIKNFYFIVGGYGKSFEKQINSYMKRLKTNYGDSLFKQAVIVTYAWGVEDDAYQYYRAVRESKNGAADFAIFQHMLEEFLSDEKYFKTHPRDINISILFSSMGNNLFKEYLEKRKEENIPLRKVYNRILFVGSVAPRNSFEKGKAFYNLDQMTDSVDVFVNSKDILLKMSSMAHLKSRMGNKGPQNEENLPGYINVWHIKDLINMKDMTGLGHDYILTNTVLHDALLETVNKRLEEQ